MIPLSRLGIGNAEKELLANRLFPEANAIFIKNLAEKSGIDLSHLEQLDYSVHPSYLMEKLKIDRERKAEILKDRIANGLVDISKHEVKYKSFEEAQEKDKKGTHIEMIGGQDLKELEKEIEALELETNNVPENSPDVVII